MKKQAAFTLVELMVTLALAIILASFALPNIRSTLLNNRITTKTNTLVGAINYARGEAISRSNSGSIVVVQPLAADKSWDEGWRVWVDINENENPDAQDIIKRFDFKNDNIEVSIDTELEYIHYINQGRVRLPSNANQITFTICHTDYERGHQVTILPTGRVRTTRFECPSS
jgi:type IV fimbrial biogenesis protein FimT